MDSQYELGPWAYTMKLCDVRTNPGLMRGHGLICGWAYPRDSTVCDRVHRLNQILNSQTCTI